MERAGESVVSSAQSSYGTWTMTAATGGSAGCGRMCGDSGGMVGERVVGGVGGGSGHIGLGGGSEGGGSVDGVLEAGGESGTGD